MKRVLFAGSPSEIDLNRFQFYRERLQQTGANTGNLLIGNAVKRQLKFEKVPGSLYHSDQKYIEENFDCIVIPASNFVNEYSDLSQLVSYIEKINLPCIAIGLGSQAPNFDYELKLPQATHRLIQIISERSKSISVRGYYTAELLNKMNINNVRVTGCPSLYTNLVPSIKINKKAFNHDLKIAVNGSRNVYKHSMDKEASVNAEIKLFELAFNNKAPYVLQNEVPEIFLINNEMNEQEQKHVELVKQFYKFENRGDDFIEFARNNFQVFFSVKNWSEFISNYDFVIGSRFHGNMIALLNGIPALVFVHDSRTREMCELMHIPHVFTTDVENINLQLLYETADYSGLEISYNALFKNYMEFLEENELDHNLEWKPMHPTGGRISGYSWLNSEIEDLKR